MMDPVHHVNVPLRAGKKMKKRKELDALVAHSAVAGKRFGSGGGKRANGGGSSGGGGGASSQDGLLSESTEDQDDYWVLGKTRGSRGRLLRRRACSSLLRACTVVLVFACVVATTTVMWLFIDIREQVTSLRIELDQVAAGSQGVPDALQKCHSVSKELQQNQTTLYNRLATLTLQIGNFSTQLTGLHNGLHDVEERLKAAPELVNVPQKIKDLSESVATFGSQIKDLDATVKSLKDQSTQLHDTSNVLVQNVTNFQTSLSQILNVSQHPDIVSQESKDESAAILSTIAQITANLTLVNDTLISKLNWLVDDQHKDHALIEILQNVGQNVTARVTTLEGECAKDSTQSALIATVKKLADNVTNEGGKMSDLDVKLTLLQTQYNKLEQQIATTKRGSDMSDELIIPEMSSQPLESTVASLPAFPSSPQPAQLIVNTGPPVKQVPAPKPPFTRP